MAEFSYNNAKNAITSYTPFELSCSFHPQVSFEKNVNPCLRSCSTNKLAQEIRKLIAIYMTCKTKSLTQSHWVSQRASAVLYTTLFYNILWTFQCFNLFSKLYQ